MAATMSARARPVVMLRDRPKSAVAEAYRDLRTAVQFLPPEKSAVMAVTSCGPGDGKTACVANLGVALAAAGRRVLLVDADLRKPGLHHFFKCTLGAGLSGLLMEQATRDVEVHTDVPGLDIVPCGPIPANPSELLTMGDLKVHLERWESDYDHILVDTPPLLGITDPLVIGRQVGRALLVVRAMRTTDHALAAALGRLGEAGIELVGVVLNGHRGAREVEGY